jgi:hypothetical protein
MTKLSTEEVGLLRDGVESQRVMSGRYGSRTIGNTDSLENLEVVSISIREDATDFATLVCTDGVQTLGAAFFLGGAAATKAGDLYTAPIGYLFREIELSAGSIQVTGPNITGNVVAP